MVRVKDALRGRFTVHLDNRGANHPRRITFSGSDDEGVVRFEFDPAVVEVPPDGGAAVQVRVMAPPPAAGERSERSLTVRAIDDGTELPAVVRLIQETSAAPVEVPVRLRLEPSALRTDDSPVAELQVVVDNRGGNRERRVRLVGHDPEKRIGFVFRSVELWVPPGVERATPAQLRAPVPPPGEQVDRTFTVTATDGRLRSSRPGTGCSGPPCRRSRPRRSGSNPKAFACATGRTPTCPSWSTTSAGLARCASACRVRIPRARSGSPSSPRSSTSGPGGSGARTCRWSRRRPRTARRACGPCGCARRTSTVPSRRPARCTSTARLRRSRRPGSPSNRSGS